MGVRSGAWLQSGHLCSFLRQQQYVLPTKPRSPKPPAASQPHTPDTPHTPHIPTHTRTQVVYIAPLKALVRERVKDWGRAFCPTLGVRMVELTGDYTPDMVGGWVGWGGKVGWWGGVCVSLLLSALLCSVVCGELGQKGVFCCHTQCPAPRPSLPRPAPPCPVPPSYQHLSWSLIPSLPPSPPLPLPPFTPHSMRSWLLTSSSAPLRSGMASAATGRAVPTSERCA